MSTQDIDTQQAVVEAIKKSGIVDDIKSDVKNNIKEKINESEFVTETKDKAKEGIWNFIKGLIGL